MTCGSGSLLLKAADESERGVTIYGQEKDNATAALAKMNMILHDNPTATIWQDNTLANPYYKNPDGSLKTFDFCVANPPFSDKAWTNGFDPSNDEFKRFEDGIPPKKNGDYGYLMHFIRSLKSNGKGAIILPHGVLFRSNAEAEIRKNIIKKGYIKGIIGLPQNLFYGTGIPACIIVIDKENSQNRTGIFMIDASKGFIKDGNKNRLREQDIHKIVDVFNKQLDLPKYSRLVLHSEISDPKNDYNLSITRYIDSQEEEDTQNIEAHLLGGIPEKDVDDLKMFWDNLPDLRNILFKENPRKGYYDLKIESQEVKSTILYHNNFISFSKSVNDIFMSWQNQHLPYLINMDVGVKPKQIKFDLSEDILQKYSGLDLVDKYDIYQDFMDYWNTTMQDDIYLITDDGWKADYAYDVKKKTFDCDLLPKKIVIEKYFQVEKQNIKNLELENDGIKQQIIELEDEHGDDEGLLSDARNEKEKFTKASIQKRLKDIKGDNEYYDEQEILEKYLELIDIESSIGKRIKDAYSDLEKKVAIKYNELTVDDIKNHVVHEKWMKAIAEDIHTEIERISQRLSQRIKILAERYEITLPRLKNDVLHLESKVSDYLEKMGYNW